MKILHVGQAASLAQKYGGAEYTDAMIMKAGVKRGHRVLSVNHRGKMTDWNTGSTQKINLWRIISAAEVCDVAIVCNIEWFLPEIIERFVDTLVGRIPFVYHPHHFTPCMYTGLPDTTEGLCDKMCKGKYSCLEEYRGLFYKYILMNASKVICLSPLHREMFIKAYGDEIDYGHFECCPPVIGEEFCNEKLDRILDTVTVGGGTFQKGFLNHITWAKENPDRTLSVYGKVQKIGKLPDNIELCGTTSNASLPSILNMYRSFLYLPQWEEPYGRVVAEAALCGCEMIVDKDKTGAYSYSTPPKMHQIDPETGNGFWNHLEAIANTRLPKLSFEEVAKSSNIEFSKDSIDSCKVGIVTAMYNQAEYTIKFLESLEKSSIPPNTFVVIVDDNSDPEELEKLCSSKTYQETKLNVEILKHTENESCTKSWNDGINIVFEVMPDVEYIVITNNDVIFPKAWLYYLVRDQRIFGAAIVGPLSNQPGSRPCQEVGLVLSNYKESDKPENIEETQAKLAAFNLLPRNVSAVNGFCMLFETSALKRLQKNPGEYFDNSMVTYGSDDDINNRAFLARMDIRISKTSFVFHYKAVTVEDNPLEHPGLLRIGKDMSKTVRAKGVVDSFNTLVKTLDNNKRVFFTRFGDADILMMSGKQMKSSGNQTTNTPDLTAEMKEAFQIDDPRFLKATSTSYPKEPGMQDGLFAPFPYNAELAEIVKRYNTSDQTLFENPVMFHYLAVFSPEVFLTFLDKYIRPKRKLFVGACSKENMEKMFGKIDFYVNTPLQNSYATMHQWYPQVLDTVVNDKIELVILASGQSSRALQARLWNIAETYALDFHSIDIGSVVDAVEGNSTRTWIRLAGDKVRRLFDG